MRVLPEVVDQHAEEAAFLWLLRDNATRAPNYDLEALAELDDRVDAHLDGLSVAGASGWAACRRELEWREAGEVFAAAHVALRSRIGRRITDVLDVALQSPALASGFVAALSWFPYADVRQTIVQLLRADEPLARWIGIAASAAHRRDPGPALTSAAADPEPVVRLRAIEAAAELGRRDLLPLCARGESSADAAERFSTAWSATLLGDASASATLCEIAVEGGPEAERACDVATRRMSPDAAAAWRRYLADGSDDGRVAIAAARASGDPDAVPWLIDLMADEALARVAGEAFTFISGVELPSAALSTEPPEGFEGGPNDDPLDDDVAMDPDENLPWPSQAAVHAWWTRNRHHFAPGTRYLMGRPVEPAALHDVLARGRQRERAAAALALTLREPGRPLFEVRARADHQYAALAALIT